MGGSLNWCVARASDAAGFRAAPCCHDGKLHRLPGSERFPAVMAWVGFKDGCVVAENVATGVSSRQEAIPLSGRKPLDYACSQWLMGAGLMAGRRASWSVAAMLWPVLWRACMACAVMVAVTA